MVATCKDFYRYMEFVIGHLGLYMGAWGRMVRDGDRSRFIPLSNRVSPYLKMADVVLLVSELGDDFDFINFIVEEEDRLNAC